MAVFSASFSSEFSFCLEVGASSLAGRSRGNRDSPHHVSWFFLVLADIMSMPEDIPPGSGFVRDKRSPPLPTRSEFSGLFTILLSFLLTTQAARRMTSRVCGMWKIRIRKRKSGAPAPLDTRQGRETAKTGGA